MQLKVAALAVAVLACSGDARAGDAEITARASAESAAYSDTDHVAVLTPSVAGHVENPILGWSIDGSYLVDVISAASVDIISTASRRWTEVRQAGELRGSFKPGDVGGAVQSSVSSEPDYFAYAAGATLTRDFNDRNLTILVGYGYGHDTIGRTGTPFSVYSHSFSHQKITAAVTLLLDRRTVVALSADVAVERGDQSKPYRYVPLFAPSVAPSVPAGATLDLVTRLRSAGAVLEQLPLARDRFGITARLARRFSGATARLEGHAYGDSWGLVAISGDGRALFDWGRRWSLGPHLRYYVQSPVSFWKLAYVSSGSDVPALRTGDRELGPLMNLTAGGSVHWAVGPAGRVDAWVLSAHADATFAAFFDDLYITRRLSSFEGLSVEATW